MKNKHITFLILNMICFSCHAAVKTKYLFGLYGNSYSGTYGVYGLDPNSPYSSYKLKSRNYLPSFGFGYREGNVSWQLSYRGPENKKLFKNNNSARIQSNDFLLDSFMYFPFRNGFDFKAQIGFSIFKTNAKIIYTDKGVKDIHEEVIVGYSTNFGCGIEYRINKHLSGSFMYSAEMPNNRRPRLVGNLGLIYYF